MIHKLLFIGGLILLITALVLHHKQHRFKMHCLHHEWDLKKKSDLIVNHISNKLDLSKTQKKKLIEIQNELVKKHQSLHPEQCTMLNSFLSEIEKETMDQDKLNRLFQQKMKKVEEMHPFAVNKLAELHATLTTEQKQKLTEDYYIDMEAAESC